MNGWRKSASAKWKAGSNVDKPTVVQPKESSALSRACLSHVCQPRKSSHSYHSPKLIDT